MMWQLGSARDKLFYSFNLDNHVPREHVFRGRCQLGEVRRSAGSRAICSATGRRILGLISEFAPGDESRGELFAIE
ncbi:hypothetical protein LMG29542_07509 [Paraburkholderia humisilvae]|uniref:Uncharacterized protein n=1 Tax=Paraburkholderia humisilvae TaxID=627669 RepID=A0A6J5F544_9BURK|nr:hypothetical protein LMG29542_07509 [Paraburkholderia humisilvae]